MNEISNGSSRLGRTPADPGGQFGSKRPVVIQLYTTELILGMIWKLIMSKGQY